MWPWIWRVDPPFALSYQHISFRGFYSGWILLSWQQIELLMNVGRASLRQLWGGKTRRSCSLSPWNGSETGSDCIITAVLLQHSKKWVLIYTTPRCVHVIQTLVVQSRHHIHQQSWFTAVCLQHTHMGPCGFIFWFTIMWFGTQEPVLCTNLCDVVTPYSSSRFLRGQPSASCPGLPEGLFGLVWSQSEWSEVRRSSCAHRLSSQRGSVAHIRHHSAAHECSTHARDRKIICTF